MFGASAVGKPLLAIRTQAGTITFFEPELRNLILYSYLGL